MSTSALMKHVGWRFWWASPRATFTHPGLYVWAFQRNLRILPVPRWALVRGARL